MQNCYGVVKNFIPYPQSGDETRTDGKNHEVMPSGGLYQSVIVLGKLSIADSVNGLRMAFWTIFSMYSVLRPN